MSGFGMVLAMQLADKCDSNNELLTLLAIGNFTDEFGRGCYAAQQTLADKVLVSVDTVKRCVPRLAAKGLITPGDPSLVADFRADRRPRVWDILGAREPEGEAGVHRAPSLNRRDTAKPSTGVHGAPPWNNPSSATVHDEPPIAEHGSTGVQTISPRGCTVHPNPPKEEPPKDPLSSSQRIVRDAGLGLTEEEERTFIAWANQDLPGGVKGVPWWRKVRDNGDLPANVERWRTARVNAEPPPRASPTRACTNCGTRFTPADPADHECPDCHAERTP
jgi:Helix-turn-helix domain